MWNSAAAHTDKNLYNSCCHGTEEGESDRRESATHRPIVVRTHLVDIAPSINIEHTEAKGCLLAHVASAIERQNHEDFVQARGARVGLVEQAEDVER